MSLTPLIAYFRVIKGWLLTFFLLPWYQSMLVEVYTVSLSNDLSVLGCTIHRGNNNPVVNKVEMWSLSSLQRGAKNIRHAGYDSQEGEYWSVLLELNGYLFPLRSTTAFKLSFERSINRRHSLGSWTRAFMRESILLEYNKLPPEKETIRTIFDACGTKTS